MSDADETGITSLPVYANADNPDNIAMIFICIAVAFAVLCAVSFMLTKPIER